MRLGNERFVPPIRVCQLPCHERGEVLFGGLKVASDPPGKAFVTEFTKPTQEALTISLRGRNQLDHHSRIHARTFPTGEEARGRGWLRPPSSFQGSRHNRN